MSDILRSMETGYFATGPREGEQALRQMLAGEFVRRSGDGVWFVPFDESLDEDGTYRITIGMFYVDNLPGFGALVDDFRRGHLSRQVDMPSGMASVRVVVPIPIDASIDEVEQVVKEYLDGMARQRAASDWLAMDDPREVKEGSPLSQRDSLRYLASPQAEWAGRDERMERSLSLRHLAYHHVANLTIYEVLEEELDQLDEVVAEENQALAFTMAFLFAQIGVAASALTDWPSSDSQVLALVGVLALLTVGTLWFGITWRRRRKRRPSLLARIRQRGRAQARDAGNRITGASAPNAGRRSGTPGY